MPLLEDRSAAFIVRVWCETGDSPAGEVRAWRGSVEHVASGQRAFFQELDAVISFMTPHLRALGIEAPDRFWERMGAAEPPPAEPAGPAPPRGRARTPRRH